MKITLLGTGTSSGVPLLGCTCEVCTSTRPYDRRQRSCALIETEGKRILIDCGPDIRQQLLAQPFGPIDAVLVTHEHYDHVGGLDDLRAFCKFGPLHIYGEAPCLAHIRERMAYCFGDSKYPSAPTLELHEITPLEPLPLDGTVILPLRVMHGTMPILGYRIGLFAYITDMKTMPDPSVEALKGTKFLVVNGLRHKPHDTHQTIEEAVTFIRRTGIPQARLIHLAHTAGLHDESSKYLPTNIRFGYDGETIVLSKEN